MPLSNKEVGAVTFSLLLNRKHMCACMMLGNDLFIVGVLISPCTEV